MTYKGKKITVYLPDGFYSMLIDLARKYGMSNAAAARFLIVRGLEEDPSRFPVAVYKRSQFRSETDPPETK